MVNDTFDWIKEDSGVGIERFDCIRTYKQCTYSLKGMPTNSNTLSHKRVWHRDTYRTIVYDLRP